ncbi:MAG: globin domain-containing protein [Gammaproteobacteria bacterium]|nr:globin domain-containing protein [Gammaproteobacteria bacterium]
MIDAQKKLVQNSWLEVSADKDQFIATLYDNFFELSPRSRFLFKRDLKLHTRNIVAKIESVIKDLNALDRVMPELIPTGGRHKDYGVTHDEFELFHVALLNTLKQFIGEGYTEELEEAWSIMYRLISSTMCSAMRINFTPT